MNTSSIIKSLRLSNSLTQKELSKRLNTSIATIQCWENGSKNPSMDAIISLSKVFHVSTDYLLGIDQDDKTDSILIMSKHEQALLSDYRMLDLHGKKLVETVCSMEKSRVLNTTNIIALNQKPLRYIPRYITPSAAGMSTPLEGDDFEMIVVDQSVPERADFAVKIQGDSMLPYICDGETVYVERTSDLHSGDIGIFSVDGAMYCKHYFRDAEGNVTLVSANPALRSTNVFIGTSSNNSITCYGKVLLNEKAGLPNYFTET